MHSAAAKRALWTFLLLSILLGAYAAWPLHGLYVITRAIETRDAAVLDHLIDYRELRRTLTDQIVGAYLKAKGQRGEAGRLSSRLALSIGTAFADPFVDQLLNSTTLLSLLESEAKNVASPIPAAPAIQSFTLKGVFGHPWRLFLASEYSGQLFYVTLPIDAARERQFRLRLRLVQWRWKLAGVGLPEAALSEIVKEIDKLARH